jgi:hypothetical protein
MYDTCTYHIQIHGRVEENELNALSPLRMKVVHVDIDTTLLAICTDQAGLIGAIRYLHGLGFALSSVLRER